MSLTEYNTIDGSPQRNKDILPSYKSNLKHIKSPDLHQIDSRAKNLEVLKYVFPFYDIDVLDSVFHGCHDDILQTVLSISSSVLENQRRYSPFDTYEHRFKPHIPHSPSSLNGHRCCDSPYCPVNSYIALRRRDSDSSPFLGTTMRRFSFNEEEINIPRKRSSTSPSSDISITNKLNNAPYCTSCKKLGSIGDKFCPICGVSY